MCCTKADKKLWGAPQLSSPSNVVKLDLSVCKLIARRNLDESDGTQNHVTENAIDGGLRALCSSSSYGRGRSLVGLLDGSSQSVIVMSGRRGGRENAGG